MGGNTAGLLTCTVGGPEQRRKERKRVAATSQMDKVVDCNALLEVESGAKAVESGTAGTALVCHFWLFLRAAYMQCLCGIIVHKQ